jgi:hypothetical protein
MCHKEPMDMSASFYDTNRQTSQIVMDIFYVQTAQPHKRGDNDFSIPDKDGMEPELGTTSFLMRIAKTMIEVDIFASENALLP